MKRLVLKRMVRREGDTGETPGQSRRAGLKVEEGVGLGGGEKAKGKKDDYAEASDAGRRAWPGVNLRRCTWLARQRWGAAAPQLSEKKVAGAKLDRTVFAAGEVLGTSALGAVVRAAAATRPAEAQCAIAPQVSTFPASRIGGLTDQNQLQTGDQPTVGCKLK